MKRPANILILLAVTVLVGYGLGGLLRPENYQLHGTLTFDPTQVPSAEYAVGDFIVIWQTNQGGQITIESKDHPGLALWQTIPGEAFVMAAQSAAEVTEKRSMFWFKESYTDLCTKQNIEKVFLENAGPSNITFVVITGSLECQSGDAVPYTLLWTGAWPSSAITVNIESDRINKTFITYASSNDEHFFGFGEQFTNFDMKGKKVPVWVSEQGVGRGEQPLTFLADITNGGAGGNEFTTYAPMPVLFSSNMYSFQTSLHERTLFDFTNPKKVQIVASGIFFDGVFHFGSTPTELIKANTGLTGHMKLLPGWIYKSAIVGMQGGSEKVQTIYDQLKQRETPIAAFWLQDWVGQRTTSFGKQLWWNWEVDYDRYPGWDQMVSDLNKDNINVMVYASPYLADIGDLKPNIRRNLFQEAKAKGYLVKNAAGEPYLVLNTDFYFGMVDLTNRDAYNWYKQVIKEQVVGSGAKGWMADFGEGLPYDAVLSAGESAEVHNNYPVLWALLNREIVDETGKELVFFNRAAYTNSPAYATLFWEGDQMVDWSREDGIKSAVTGLNTSGLSGMAYNHSDIGGYTTVSNPLLNIHRSRELLYRWMEMNAFTLIFRTHEGNQPDKNIQFYTDAESLDTFAYWAKVYAALFDYRKHLVAEAAESGLPVVRHPFIHYPADPETWKITYQEFMLGSDFLIAPVTDEGTTNVKAYLPQGEWIHLWSGEQFTGGQYVTVAAPLGQPGVFYLKDSKWGADFTSKLKAQGLLP